MKRVVKNMENDSIMSRLPIREHIRNMKKLLEILNKLDDKYFKITMVVHIINVIVPFATLILSSYVLDAIAQGVDVKDIIVTVAVTLVCIFVLKFIASTIWNSAQVRRERMYNVYETFVEMKTINMDFSRIDSPEVGKLKERIRRDTNWGWGINTPIFRMNDLLYGTLNILASIIVAFPVLKSIVATRDYRIALLIAALVLVVLIIIKIRAVFMKLQHQFMFEDVKDEDKEEIWDFSWEFSLHSKFKHNNIKDVKIYDGHDLIERWTLEPRSHKKYWERIKKGSIGFGMCNGLQAMLDRVTECSAYFIVVMVALTQTISVGSVVVFAGSLSRLLNQIIGVSECITDFAMEARKQCSTLELIELEDEMYKGKLPVEKRSDNEYQIEFKNVSFKYPGTEEYVLKDFSVKLKIGEKLAIVGMNGSGKTTMIKLLCRLYDVNEGEILLNGVNIQKFDQDEYRRLFSIVFQDFNIFPYTLGQNVAADVKYDKEKVIDCLNKAGFGERLCDLNEGLDTFVTKEYDDGGVEFSGGELQKIAIARAIYKEAPFILLDEPTAALDPLAEYEIYSNFDKIIGTKTAIYISHRLSSCRFCKKIAVFHEGRLVQLGSHDELVKEKNGKYYEMWSAQAQYYQEG